MALRIEYETPYGITCEYAHCIVRDVSVNKREETNFDEEAEEDIVTKTFPVQYSGVIYASTSAYADGASPIGGFNGSFELDTSGTKNQYNAVKQAYNHLKTLDGFTDGVDC